MTTMTAINTTVLPGSSNEVNGTPQITATSQHAGIAIARAMMELKRTSENLDPLPLRANRRAGLNSRAVARNSCTNPTRVKS